MSNHTETISISELMQKLQDCKYPGVDVVIMENMYVLKTDTVTAAFFHKDVESVTVYTDSYLIRFPGCSIAITKKCSSIMITIV